VKLMLFRALFIVLSGIVSGCANTTVQSPPPGVPTAYLIDRVVARDRTTFEFYVVSAIDGRKVENSYSASKEKHRGRALVVEQELVRVTHEVAARPVRLQLEAKVMYGAAHVALANIGRRRSALTILEVELVEKGSYLVQGVLLEDRAEVWLVDAKGKRVGTIIGSK